MLPELVRLWLALLVSSEAARGREGEDLLLVGSLLDLLGEAILFTMDEVGDAGAAVDASRGGVGSLPVSLKETEARCGTISRGRPSSRSSVRDLRTVDIGFHDVVKEEEEEPMTKNPKKETARAQSACDVDLHTRLSSRRSLHSRK